MQKRGSDKAKNSRIGVVVHGPEIIDSGRALQLINYLKGFGRVTPVLGGTMGRLALFDAGLKGLISVSPRRRPSQSIRDLEADSDIIFLLNQAKSRESGLAFGAMVGRAAGTSKPLIQIDCGGRFLAVLLSGEADHLAAEMIEEIEALIEEEMGKMASDLGLDLIRPWPSSQPPIQAEPMPGEIRPTAGNTNRRTLSGVLPGELISINGTVIGRATEGPVAIEVRGGRIASLLGIIPKQHGIDKLPPFDLAEAIIRSGSIRRSRDQPKLKATQESRAGSEKEDKDVDGLDYAVFIDHCAEDAFEAAERAGFAVTVGDDTTAIAGDILARLGVLVIGIVDGDLDCLAESTTMLPGSVVLRARSGHDDLIGRSVSSQIFRGRSRIAISRREMLSRIMDLAGENIVSIERVEHMGQ